MQEESHLRTLKVPSQLNRARCTPFRPGQRNLLFEPVIPDTQLNPVELRVSHS